MEDSPESYLDYPNSELVFGIVSPTGTNTDAVVKELKTRLESYKYDVKPIIKVSDLFNKVLHGVEIDSSDNFERIKALMRAGDQIRIKANRGDVLALMCAVAITDYRTNENPNPRTAYIIDSLKHPDEVASLRKIYGPGFFLIGIHASKRNRIDHFANKNIVDPQPQILFALDEEEKHPLGQKTRDTYYLSDFFVSIDDDPRFLVTKINDFVDLIFGDPFITPSFDEHAMHIAFATSFRSGDLSRQVGAVIFSKSRELLAEGTNEVPRFGGGIYYRDDKKDRRDRTRKRDSNDWEKNRILKEMVELIVKDDEGLKIKYCNILKKSSLFDITEFSRATHAEMEAIISCARKGISLTGSTLYTTTFPCHNCAKHIVNSGIENVIYVEPYPKSKAGSLHDDSIVVDPESEENDLVKFKPFMGVGARRFMDLYSMKLSSGRPLKRKESDGKLVKFNQDSDQQVRTAMSAFSYLEREKNISIEVSKILTQINSSTTEELRDDK